MPFCRSSSSSAALKTPARYERAIATRKKVLVQIALWNASDRLQVTNFEGGLKR